MANIDLFVCLTGNASDYATFLKKVSLQFVSNKHNINWKYIVSGKIQNNPIGYKYIAKVKKEKFSSMSHGKALNKAFSFAIEKYVIMIDSDMVLLYPHWDDIIVKNLDKDIVAFGASSPKTTDRAKNFPFIYFFCYRQDLLKGVKLDFCPVPNTSGRDLKKGVIETKREEKVMGISMGEKYRFETSSKIPFIFYDNNFKSKSMECILGNEEKAKLPFLNKKSKEAYLQIIQKSRAKQEYMAEWHYNDELFASHLRASITNSFKEYYTQHWVKRIKLYIKNQNK